MDEYFGFREVPMSDEEISKFYNGETKESYGCLINEYLVINDSTGQFCEAFKWNGTEFLRVPFKQINSRFFGKVKPRNLQQQLALDMLYSQDETVKVLVGKFGTGKDYLMSSAAIDLLEKGKYEKIVWVRNNIEVRTSFYHLRCRLQTILEGLKAWKL